jgi:cholesterol transport system auxiliary component
MGTATATDIYPDMICRALLLLSSVLLLAGCTSLPAPQTINPNTYVLNALPAMPAARTKHDIVLAVSMTQAQPGFDTAQIAYVQKPFELNYFATSRWIEPPAHMLTPLLMQALQQSGGFRAVVQTPGAVPADIRLDTELVQLRHNFETRPSRVELTLRATLIDMRGRRVIAAKQFDDAENAASEDAYGGVVAANRLLQRMLGELTNYCVNESVIQ